MRVTIISGSSREKALSKRVALMLQNDLKKNYPETEFNVLDIRDFPLPFVEDVFANHHEIPESHSGLNELIFEADAFILISPEYNGSYSSVLKNLLDHFPKFTHKAFGIVSYSVGALGGMRAAQQMQLMVCAFFGIPSPHMMLLGNVDKKIDESGAIVDGSVERPLHTFTKEFMWLAKALKNGE